MCVSVELLLLYRLYKEDNENKKNENVCDASCAIQLRHSQLSTHCVRYLW